MPGRLPGERGLNAFGSMKGLTPPSSLSAAVHNQPKFLNYLIHLSLLHCNIKVGPRLSRRSARARRRCSPRRSVLTRSRVMARPRDRAKRGANTYLTFGPPSRRASARRVTRLSSADRSRPFLPRLRVEGPLATAELSRCPSVSRSERTENFPLNALAARRRSLSCHGPIYSGHPSDARPRGE